MRKWVTALVAIGLLAGAAQLWLRPLFASKCINGICIGSPLPDMSGYGPEVAARASRGEPDIHIDLRENPPLSNLLIFRPPTPVPAVNERATEAELVIHRGADGKVRHVRMYAVYADASVMWAPHQTAALASLFKRVTGSSIAVQQINWQRQGVWQTLDRVHGIRGLMQVWPGSAGFATLKLDIGYTDLVHGVEK